jgi:hypothetical protein
VATPRSRGAAINLHLAAAFTPPRHMTMRQKPSQPNQFLTLGGRVQCAQCQARSKRTGKQCRAPAAKGKTKCKHHGGASTGPKTPEGKERSAAAKTVHGRETRKKRRERSLASARLTQWEALGYALGMMTGPRTRGRKPGSTE